MNFALFYLRRGIYQNPPVQVLVALATVQSILDRKEFLESGLPFLQLAPDRCPFCDLPLDGKQRTHIQDTLSALEKDAASQEAVQEQRDEVLTTLSSLSQDLQLYQNRQIKKTSALLALADQDVLLQLKAILVPKYTEHFLSVETAIADIKAMTKKLKEAHSKVTKKLTAVTESGGAP